VRFGRKPKLTAHQASEALARRQAGEALVEIGRSYNVSHSTLIEALAPDNFQTPAALICIMDIIARCG
jgi:hypothetical protein